MKAEIEKRISEMENPSYQFPLRFGKRDYLFAAAIGALCLSLLIAGAFF
ncbi:hypothetical protein ACYULU_05055 [Breznakiellaceae bacterium SP9]